MNIYFLLMFACCCLSQASANLEKEWRMWKSRFSKEYGSSEAEAERRRIWERNLNLVKAHNNRLGTGFTMGMNALADQESPIRRTIIKKITSIDNGPAVLDNFVGRTFAPPAFDWRKRGVISPVRNEGQLGDVVAIVTAESVESYHAITMGPLFNLSVQEVADCCNRGLIDLTFECVHKIGGLCKAPDYKESPCNSPTCSQVATINGGANVRQGDETALQTTLLLMPVFVAIDASHPSFQLYQSGIYNEPACSSTQLDHGLQLVGYGTDSTGNDFWICKNSWGVNWGMAGYIYMSRNKGNQCGIASDAVYPV